MGNSQKQFLKAQFLGKGTITVFAKWIKMKVFY